MSRGRHVKDIRPPVFTAGGVLIPLTRGLHAIIDAGDLPLVSGRNWYAGQSHNAIYALSHEKAADGTSPTLRMHRVILGAKPGDIVDHRDGNGLDNRRANLRWATSAENTRNRAIFPTNTSGFKGVSWDDEHGLWRARITFDRRVIHLGRFSSREAAHDAYARAAKRLHGDFARTA